MGSIPGLGRFPGGGNGNPLKYSCLENPMDREAWWATVHGASKSQAQLSNLAVAHIHIYTFFYWVVCFFVIEPHELFAYFADELFVSSFICKYFLPFCGLSSYFVYGFLCPGRLPFMWVCFKERFVALKNKLKILFLVCWPHPGAR